MNFRFISLFLFVFILSTSVFAAEVKMLAATQNVSSMYNVCVNQYGSDNVDKDCAELVSKAKLVSEILNTIYLDDVTDEDYISCVKDKVSNNVLNYTTVRDSCYTQIMQTNKLKTLVSLFKVSCLYDKNTTINKNGAFDLSVTCKSILPSTCFYVDAGLIQDANVGYKIVPKVIRSNSNCFDLARIEVNTKVFELQSLSMPVTIDQYVIENTDGNVIPFENLFENNVVSRLPELTNIETSYFDCVANYYLHNEFDARGITIRGKVYDDNEVINTCKTKVTYAYAVYIDKVEENRRALKSEMISEFNNFLVTSDLLGMQGFFDTILSKYDLYEKELSKLSKGTGRVSLNLDLNYLIVRLQHALEGKDADSRREIINAFRVTLMNNIEDKIEIRHKKNIPQLISFFNQETNSIADVEMQKIFASLKKDVIMEMINREEILDLTDVDFTLTPGSLQIGDLTLLPGKSMIIYGDKNLSFSSTVDSLTFGELNSLTIETKLPIVVKSNRMYINDKNVIVLNTINTSNLPGKVNKVELIVDVDGFPIYIVSKQLNGYFLGMFKVTEMVTEHYNADKGNLFEVDKPWWDFLIVYKNSVQEKVSGVTN